MYLVSLCVRTECVSGLSICSVCVCPVCLVSDLSVCPVCLCGVRFVCVSGLFYVSDVLTGHIDQISKKIELEKNIAETAFT